MEVLLVQHGQAVSKEQDPERPLSKIGRAEVERVAAHLAGRLGAAVGLPIVEVRHSGKLRAQQTADILARHIAPEATFKSVSGLNPTDEPESIADELNANCAARSAIMLVGHLPNLARLAGRLLTGQTDLQPVRFRNAGVVRLSWDDRWSVDWILWPETV